MGDDQVWTTIDLPLLVTGGDRVDRSVVLRRFLYELESVHLIAFLGDVALFHFPLFVERSPEVVGLAVDNRLEALRVTNISSRCQRRLRQPRSRLILFRLRSVANSGPILFDQNRTVS